MSETEHGTPPDGPEAQARSLSPIVARALGAAIAQRRMYPPEHPIASRALTSLAQYLERLRTSGIARAEFDLTAATTMFMGTLFADAISRDIMPMIYNRPPEQAIEQYVDLFLRSLGVAEEGSVPEGE